MHTQSFSMSEGAIAFIPVECVHWKLTMVFMHEPVAIDFGYNGSRRNGNAQLVALWNPLLKGRYRECVRAVNKKIVWNHSKAADRLKHCLKSSLENVDFVDFTGIHAADAKVKGMRVDLIV
jgi:hypothetical protein